MTATARYGGACTLILALIAFQGDCDALGTETSLEHLRKVPTTARYDGVDMRLTASLVRDFMPTGVSSEAEAEKYRGGRPGYAMIQLSAGPAAASLHAVEVWIVQGDQVFETKDIEERGAGPKGNEIIVRNGPKWAPESEVDVIVRYVDGQSRIVELAARHQVVRGVS